MTKAVCLMLGTCVLALNLGGCCCSHFASQPPGCPPPPSTGFFGSARIAPPGTSSYQVAAGNQPYYTPNPSTTSGVGSSSATNVAAGNLQTGWRSPDGLNPAGFFGTQPPTGSAGSNATGFQQPGDYSSTTIDERFDATRMPANDATMVRAPTNFSPSGNWQALTPNAGMANYQVPGTLEFRTTPQINGGSTAGFNSMASQSTIGYPTLPPLVQSPPTVLAQASTAPETLARDPNYQAGWRDRFTTGTYMNR